MRKRFFTFKNQAADLWIFQMYFTDSPYGRRFALKNAKDKPTRSTCGETMNIFEFAKKMEKDGEAYYSRLAGYADFNGLRSILEMLADAERKHYNVLLEMEGGASPEVPETGILDNARNVFESMDKDFFGPDTALPQIEAYKKALSIEKQSREFYEQRAGESGDQAHKAVFLKIAEEERQHFFLMEEMLEFMQRPFRWLENAEWHHFEEY